MDPATITAIGTAAGGLGNLAAGLGFGSNDRDGLNIAEQVQFAKAMGNVIPHNTIKQVEGTMKAAKSYGIHPMYLLGGGVSGASPQTYVSGGASGKGTDYAQAGRGLEKMASALGTAKGDAVQEAMTVLGLRQAKADTLRSEYNAEIEYLELQRMKQAANANQESAITYPARPGPNDPDDVHRRTASGAVYSTRGGGVREDDLGGLWGEVQNFLHGLNDPALNPLAPYGKAIGKTIQHLLNQKPGYRTGGSY